jgi:hypothetical protein
MKSTLHRICHPKQWRASAKPLKTKGKGKAIDSHTIPLGDLPEVPSGTLRLNPKQSINLSFGEKDKYIVKRARPGLSISLVVPEDKVSGRKKGNYVIRFDGQRLKLGSYLQARQHSDQFYVELLPESGIANLVRKMQV